MPDDRFDKARELEISLVLQHCGIVDSREKIKYWNVDIINPAYVIPTLGLPTYQQAIFDYLKELNIYPCGRFGAWSYLNMDLCIIEGKKVADKINKKL